MSHRGLTYRQILPTGYTCEYRRNHMAPHEMRVFLICAYAGDPFLTFPSLERVLQWDDGVSALLFQSTIHHPTLGDCPCEFRQEIIGTAPGNRFRFSISDGLGNGLDCHVDPDPGGAIWDQDGIWFEYTVDSISGPFGGPVFLLAHPKLY
jgi:hypothetical protein